MAKRSSKTSQVLKTCEVFLHIKIMAQKNALQNNIDFKRIKQQS